MPGETQVVIDKPKTLGISPKVLNPALMQVIIGVLLIVLGEEDIGVGLVISSGLTVGGGAVASAGKVQGTVSNETPIA